MAKFSLVQLSLVLLAIPSLVLSFVVSNTFLVIARDDPSADAATIGLDGYGIPYQVLLVPQSGAKLPALTANNNFTGNFGAIVVLGEVSYDYGGGQWHSALTPQQWAELYDYQEDYGVRMIRLDVYPTADVGCSALGSTGDDQPIKITNATGFATANLKTGATMSTAGLWHFPAAITNTSLATEIARFDAGGTSPASTAAVINNFGKRQQQVWFISWGTEWSPTSNFLMHAWIHWATRGLYGGFRRVYLNTQVDDMFLSTPLYSSLVRFRVRPDDLQAHKDWMPRINAKMPKGSDYFIEIAHNGNGDIDAAVTSNPKNGTCIPSTAIYYPAQVPTAPEFQKQLGTGGPIWPQTPTNYTWSLACAQVDPLEQWWATPSNRDAFSHVSHTFAHAPLNNATYADVYKEIQFNQKWLAQVGISASSRFSANGLVPPQITGLHNGDAIRAWKELGITNAVGDNTRPVLRNSNTFWPLISTVADNGFAGLNIVPRWSTKMYFDCDLPACTLKEWIETSNGAGDYDNLLKEATYTNSRNLLGLHWDPYMFHQANMRVSDVPSTMINGVLGKYSLLQSWVEVVVAEMTRLTTWPIVTLKHDDIAAQFLNRMTRDRCKPNLYWIYSDDGKTITGAAPTTTGNTCSAPIPITFPGPVTNANGGKVEQRGNDPLTIWFDMKGKIPVYTLQKPIAV